MPLRPRFAVEAWQEPVDLLARGQRAFEGRRFYEAQILWEAESLAASGELRNWIQGLATLAGGMLALAEHRRGSAERLLARGRWLVASAGDELAGIDLSALLASVDDALDELRRREPALSA